MVPMLGAPKQASLLLAVLLWVSSAATISIRDYGAVPDGRTDSSRALQKAWADVCALGGNAALVIPQGTYLIGPVVFKGPCKGPVRVQLHGTLLARSELSLYKPNWIEFQYLDGLVVSGHGKVHGQGARTWGLNRCHQNHKSDCKTFPMSMVFSFVRNATISGITSVDSKNFHLMVFGCRNIAFDSIKITAPGDSPNTDGIHIAVSENVVVQNSVIRTGDDCISIGDKTVNLTVAGVTCGPGHGISIGSLGRNANEQDLVGLHIRNCTFDGTTNGVRIKTWENGPKNLLVRDVVFEDVIMNNVQNPIIIDQKYCPSRTCPNNLKPSRVKITNVQFNNIVGTSATKTAINLICSAAFPCDVQLKHVDLKYVSGQANAFCVNVKANLRGMGFHGGGSAAGAGDKRLGARTPLGGHSPHRHPSVFRRQAMRSLFGKIVREGSVPPSQEDPIQMCGCAVVGLIRIFWMAGS
ncbi:hypothetical protein HPP92_022521 [Vanilla planifolia]|uniref:Exopolygalacturonase n=1 Tax=Vanilla planifolia TaxID=51239 RepID=A0A835PTI1_VANPL|nr:hypothetical protein HPP92_022521 [Vanilla planifolia]